MRAPAKALGQTGLLLPVSVSPLHGDAVRQEYCCLSVAILGFSRLSYEDHSSIHAKWIHSGFWGAGRMGSIDSFSSHLHFRPGISHKIKKRIKFPMQPQFIMQHPRASPLSACERWREILSIALNLRSELGQDRPRDFHSKPSSA